MSESKLDDLVRLKDVMDMMCYLTQLGLVSRENFMLRYAIGYKSYGKDPCYFYIDRTVIAQAYLVRFPKEVYERQESQ
jgi:hypothetical protein